MSGSADNYILANDKHSQQLTTCHNTRTENDPTHQINPLFAGLVSGPRQAQLYCARQASCCCCDRCCVLSTDTEQTSAVSVCLSDSHITHSLCVAFLVSCLVPRLGLLSVRRSLRVLPDPLASGWQFSCCIGLQQCARLSSCQRSQVSAGATR